MKLKAICYLFFTVFLCNFSVAAQEGNCRASKDLPNLGCVNANLYRGAQPTAEGIKELARRGVKTIINLRDADKNSRFEAEQARQAGIKFINVPLGNWFAPKDAKIAEIMSLLDNAENQPFFVHCQHGADRTGTVIAAYRISHDGWTLKQVKTEAKSHNFGWWQIWMNGYIINFYKDFQKRKNQTPKATDGILDS